MTIPGPRGTRGPWLVPPYHPVSFFQGRNTRGLCRAAVCPGFLVWFWVGSVYPAAGMAPFSFLAPVFGVISGWLILGALTGSVLWALAMVRAGVYRVNRRPRRSRRPARWPRKGWTGCFPAPGPWTGSPR